MSSNNAEENPRDDYIPETTISAIGHETPPIPNGRSGPTWSARLGKCQQMDGSEDIDEAISMVSRMSAGYQVRPDSNAFLLAGTHHYKRFQQTGSIDDLNCAFDAVGEACHSTTQGIPDEDFSVTCAGQERPGIPATVQRGIEIFVRSVTNGDRNGRSFQCTPQGETIYANTPQHHGTVGLLQMDEEPSIGDETGASPRG